MEYISIYGNNVDFSGIDQDISDFVTYYDMQIAQEIKWEAQSMEFFTVIPNVEGIYVAPASTMTEVMQAYQVQLTGKGLDTIDREYGEIKRCKTDFPYDPVPFYDEWITFLYKEGLTAEMHPFEMFLIEEVVRQHEDDIETFAAIGNYKTPTESVAGQAEYALNGYYTVVKELIFKNKITPLAVFEYNKDTILEDLEDATRNLPDKYKYTPMNMLASIQNADDYAFNYRQEYQVNDGVATSQEVVQKIYRTNTMLRGVGSMNGLNTFIASYQSNMRVAMSRRGAKNIQSWKQGRLNWLLYDSGLAFVYVFPQFVFVCGEIIEPPQIIATAANVTAATADLSWREVAQATEYFITVSVNEDLSAPIIDNQSVPAASTPVQIPIPNQDVDTIDYRITYQATGLAGTTTYYWAVKTRLTTDAPVNTEYTSVFSEVGNFTTL